MKYAMVCTTLSNVDYTSKVKPHENNQGNGMNIHKEHMNLDEYLFKNRKRFNLKDFANELGVGAAHLSRIVNGHHVPSVKLAKEIQRATSEQVIWYELIDWCWNQVYGKE